jgi:hypothetical protein
MYVQTFSVEGDGQFPIDMLRYDRCYPHTEHESYEIMRSHDGESRKFRVKLQRIVYSKTPPTQGRWESFCWKVDEHSIETVKA